METVNKSNPDQILIWSVSQWPLSDTSICRCWYNAWLVGHNLTESIITLEIMTQLCWDIWPEVTRSSQYPLITSSPTLSPPAQWSLSSHQTQGRAVYCVQQLTSGWHLIAQNLETLQYIFVGKGRVNLVRDPNYVGDRNFMVVRNCLMSGCHEDIEYHKSSTQLWKA